MPYEECAMRNAMVFFVAALLLACDPGLGAVLPPGSVVPSVHDDALLDAQIDESDQVERVVLRVQGFAEGTPAWYWDFGLVPDGTTMPIYRVCRRRGALCDRLEGHPWIVEHLPGEPAFRHYGRVIDVPVTDAYAGELITSRAAIDAVRAGLVEAPESTERAAHVIVVHRDVQLELGGGAMLATTPVYVRGMQAAAIDFSATHGFQRLEDPELGTILERNVYVLTREGESEPLVERMKGADLTGDGDTEDTNTILGVAYSSASYTPLWRMVTVTVPMGYASIDTSMDDEVADYRSAEDMFTIDADYAIEPIAGQVVDHDVTDMLVDCPLQSAPGSP